MSKPAAANLLACLLMIAQIAAAFLLSVFRDSLSQAAASVSGLLLINQLFVIFVPTAIFIFYMHKASYQPLSDFLRLNPLSGKNIILIVLMCVAIQPIMSVLSFLSLFFFNNDVSGLALDMAEDIPFIQMVFIMALLPSVFEELAMRGAILSSYGNRLNLKSTILINGLLFGMLHLNGHQFLYATALGVFFAYIVIKTNSLFASVIGHFTINFSQTALVSVLSAYLESPQYAEFAESADAAGLEGLKWGAEYVAAYSITLIYILTAIIVFYWLLLKFNRLNSGKRAFFTSFTGNETEASLELFPADSRNEGFQTAMLYLSLFVSIAVFFIFMALTGLTMPQALFLLFVFAFILLVLFLFRFRG